MGDAKTPVLRRLVPLACLAAGVLATPPVARAEDVTAEQAQDLQQQLQDWLADLAGPKAKLGDWPLPITAAGDHFLITLPLDQLLAGSGATVTGGPLAGQLRQLDDSRWSLDYTLPSPFSIAVSMAGQSSPTVTTLTAAANQSHSEIDLSLATPSTNDSTVSGYASDASGPGGEQHVRVEKGVSHLVARPVGDRRLDVQYDADVQLITMNVTPPGAGLVSLSAASVRLVQKIDTISLDAVPPIVRAVVALAPELRQAQRAATAEAGDPAAPAPAPMPSNVTLSPESRAAVHDALLALGGLSSGFDQQATFEDVHMEAQGFSGSFARLQLGMGVAAPEGKLGLTMHFGIDGLDSPLIPAGALHDLVPHHIALTPRVGGLPGKPALDLLVRALDSDGKDPDLQADSEALLRQSPVALGLDDVAFDIGPAQVAGQGAIEIADRDTYSGRAHITATGLDALIRLASGTPELKQALPVLIFLKGIGLQDGDQTVWDITWKDHKVLVNGADMTHMMPGK